MHTPPTGLTATELALALDELRAEHAGLEVRDVAQLEGRDDLLAFLDGAPRTALHVAPGGTRARIATTRRRFPKEAFATGPRVDRVRELLVGAVLETALARPGDRSGTVTFRRGDGTRLRLEIELFGPRGLWALTAEDGVILVLSRLPTTKDRVLRPGERYAPPPPAPARVDPSPRFAAPVLEAIDAFYGERDRADEASSERAALLRAVERHAVRARRRVEGLERQREAMLGAEVLREQADLLLAYGTSLPEGASELRVAHPSEPEREVVVPRDPRVPPHVQAERLYKQARKYADGLRVCEAQLAEARALVTELEGLAVRLSEAMPDLAALRAELERRGVVRPSARKAPDPEQQRLRKLTGGENFRRFTSAEGHPILVGRDNLQNDRLTLRVARGNDVWLHVGRGHAGSHVVVRLPKGRTASLETLLDAATLAVHFSKLRGAELAEVLYTPAKNVRKPKGLPPGKVVPSRTKTLRVRLEQDRLERLLSSADSPGPR